MLGLVPGFALQDGDLMAKLFTDMGAWGLGALVNREFQAQGNSRATAAQIRSSVTLVTHAVANNNAVRVPIIPECTSLRLFNHSSPAHAILVYPPNEYMRIGELAPGASVTMLATHAALDLLYVGGGQWYAIVLNVL